MVSMVAIRTWQSGFKIENVQDGKAYSFFGPFMVMYRSILPLYN